MAYAPAAAPSESEALVLMTVAYFRPITRGELSRFFGRAISRDLSDFVALAEAGLFSKEKLLADRPGVVERPGMEGPTDPGTVGRRAGRDPL